MSIKNIKGLVGWYDANDSSTIILLGQYWRAQNTVYQWNNKASKLNNITYYWGGNPTIESKDGMKYLNNSSNGGWGVGSNTMDFVDINNNILKIYTIFLVGNFARDNPWMGAGGLINQKASWPILGMENKTLLQYNEPSTATYYINGVKNNAQTKTLDSNGNETFYPFNIIKIDFNPPAYFSNISILQMGIGNLAEIIMFENSISLSDSDNVYSYLQKKWNKSLPPLPSNKLCNYTLTNNELKCYQNNYPDLKGMTNSEIQNHWSNIGCNEYRNNQCPSYQISSGLYNYTGCYNDACYVGSKETVLENNRGLISSIDECQDIAENNRETIFGVHNNGNCWTGNNLVNAKKYGENLNSNNCKTLGGICTQQLYVRRKAFPPPPPPIPKLTNPDFSNDNLTDTFENYNNNNIIFLSIFIILIMVTFLYLRN